MTLTESKYRQGMTTRQYIHAIKVNKQPFLDIYEAVVLPSRAETFVKGLNEPLGVAVFTADWCGDAMSTTPAVLRLADSTDKIEVKIFNRDEELDLANSFLPEDRAGTVPVFVVLDSSMREIARFIETAKELVPAIDAMDEQIARDAAADTEDDPRAVVRGKRTAFRVARAHECGSTILEAFVRVIEDGLGLPAQERPAVGGTEWPQATMPQSTELIGGR